MKDDVTFVILGGTGDLARAKLVPSLYEFYKEGKVGEFNMIGILGMTSPGRST